MLFFLCKKPRYDLTVKPNFVLSIQGFAPPPNPATLMLTYFFLIFRSNAFQIHRKTSPHCRWAGEAGRPVPLPVAEESRYVPDTETLPLSRRSEERRQKSRSATLNRVIKWKLHGQSGGHGVNVVQRVEEEPGLGFGTAKNQALR